MYAEVITVETSNKRVGNVVYAFEHIFLTGHAAISQPPAQASVSPGAAVVEIEDIVAAHFRPPIHRIDVVFRPIPILIVDVSRRCTTQNDVRAEGYLPGLKGWQSFFLEVEKTQRKRSAKKSAVAIREFPHSEIELLELRRIEERDSVPRSILKATWGAFVRWGYSKTTLTDIAREAGISRANIYNYFTDGKDSILAELLRIKGEAFDEQFSNVIPMIGPAAEIFVNRLVFGIQHAREDPLNVELIAAGESSRLLQFDLMAAEGSFWRRAFAYASERGDLRPGVDFENGFRWVYLVMVSILYVPQSLDSSEEIRKQLEMFLVPVLCSR